MCIRDRFYTAVQGDARGNSTILVIDGGNLACEDKVAIEMLYKQVGQRFFNELRTKQQTGYVAQTGLIQAARRTLAQFVVVSSWAGAADLLGRFETFIGGMLAGLKDGSTLSAQNFGTIQSSLLSEFSKPIANIAGMAGILQEVVKDYDGDFDAFKKRQRIIQEMSMHKIEAAATKMFATTNQRRLAVLYSPDSVSPGVVPAAYAQFDASVGEFQKRPVYKCDVCYRNCTDGTMEALEVEHQEFDLLLTSR
eukprot:TRINITY_DN9951_c0_g1_i2.p1 TRINITY_DN9951_c0_g1~~TRINITY_DN9951_c0_g1_i2.p1  ORF type:complete len:251 (-),score=67.19 TRINITY_DN9951_c0_g1_i2:85-837(-)